MVQSEAATHKREEEELQTSLTSLLKSRSGMEKAPWGAVPLLPPFPRLSRLWVMTIVNITIGPGQVLRVSSILH